MVFQDVHCVLKNTDYNEYYPLSVTKNCIFQHNDNKPVIDVLRIQELEQIKYNYSDDSD